MNIFKWTRQTCRPSFSPRNACDNVLSKRNSSLVTSLKAATAREWTDPSVCECAPACVCVVRACVCRCMCARACDRGSLKSKSRGFFRGWEVPSERLPRPLASVHAWARRCVWTLTPSPTTTVLRPPGWLSRRQPTGKDLACMSGTLHPWSLLGGIGSEKQFHQLTLLKKRKKKSAFLLLPDDSSFVTPLAVVHENETAKIPLTEKKKVAGWWRHHKSKMAGTDLSLKSGTFRHIASVFLTCFIFPLRPYNTAIVCCIIYYISRPFDAPVKISQAI